jgi:deoxyribodipyrimidine photo-lyase
MRELSTIGWMHNRMRMIVGSFLVKDLLIPWHDGARWFWDTLVDADLAQNTLGWQWTAGCGADAAPYFRMFNPVIQGAKFDPHGDYVRRWCPELAKLPTEWLHQPWRHPPQRLSMRELNSAVTIRSQSSRSVLPANSPLKPLRKSRSGVASWTVNGSRHERNTDYGLTT